MSDLINRQKVLNTLDFADKALTDEVRTVENFKAILTECIKVLPSAENRGEWILDETDNSVECNKCLCQIYPNDILYGEPHFCPNCGADMRTAEKPETCKGCLTPCIMYEPDMRACKKKVTERGE